MPAPCFPDGPFTQADLDARGISRGALRRALAEQSVRRVTRGVFALAGIADSFELRTSALARSVAPEQVVCDRTAGWLYGVDLLGTTHREVLPPIEICAVRGRQATERGETRGRTRDLLPEDIALVGELRVTTPLRTALDLGCILRRRDAIAALDQFRARFHFSRDDLARSTVRYFRRRGVVQLRELIPLSDPAAESVRESWTRLAILDAGLPAPVVQYWIEIDGVPTYRLDLAYPSRRVAVEYDGEEFHSTPEQRAHDNRRRSWLAAHGWELVVVRRGDFSGDRLDSWLTDLRRALARPVDNLRW